MDDVIKLGGELHWYGDKVVSIFLANKEIYNFYSGKLEEDIHNHRSNMHSTIIQGAIRNNIFKCEPKADGQYSQYIGRCQENCNAASNFCCQFDLVEPNVEVTRITYFDSYPGNTYWLGYQQIHNVQKLTENIITHIQFGPMMQYKPCRIRPRSDLGIACALGESPSNEELWSIIEQVVENK
jgi:hypothetical protein